MFTGSLPSHISQWLSEVYRPTHVCILIHNKKTNWSSWGNVCGQEAEIRHQGFSVTLEHVVRRNRPLIHRGPLICSIQKSWICLEIIVNILCRDTEDVDFNHPRVCLYRNHPPCARISDFIVLVGGFFVFLLSCRVNDTYQLSAQHQPIVSCLLIIPSSHSSKSQLSASSSIKPAQTPSSSTTTGAWWGRLSWGPDVVGLSVGGQQQPFPLCELPGVIRPVYSPPIINTAGRPTPCCCCCLLLFIFCHCLLPHL